MPPVIDHTKFASKQEWLDSYPEWSITGVTTFILHRWQHAQTHTQINAALYVAVNTVGPFVLAYFFPSLLGSPIVAMLTIFIGYNYLLPLWTPHEVVHDTSVNTQYRPTQSTVKHEQTT